MRPEPRARTAPGLDRAIQTILKERGISKVCVLGRPKLARLLTAEGLQVLGADSEPGGAVEAVVAVGELTRVRPEDVRKVLDRLTALLVPEGLLLVAELAAEGSVGRRVLGLLRGLRHRAAPAPEALCQFLLEAGLRPVEQVWPQGVASWVLTYGHLAPLRALRTEAGHA